MLIDKALELSIKKQIIIVNPLPQHKEKEVVRVITYMFGDLDFCMEKKEVPHGKGAWAYDLKPLDAI